MSHIFNDARPAYKDGYNVGWSGGSFTWNPYRAERSWDFENRKAWSQGYLDGQRNHINYTKALTEARAELDEQSSERIYEP